MRRHGPRPPLGHPGHRMPGPMRGVRGPPPPRPMGIPPLASVGPSLHQMACSISSCTNSNDPVSMDSRLFVGNLNTIALNKEAVEAIFSHYGKLVGISLHKGFAFVQFQDPDDARWAGGSEDGKIYANQALDINIVSQPKNRSALKRSNSGKGNNDSVKKSRQESTVTASSTANQSLLRNLISVSSQNSIKSNVLSKNGTATSSTAVSKRAVTTTTQPSSLVTPRDTDILICGVCKYQFPSLESYIQHKRVPCRLRSSCQCQQNDSGDSPPVPALIECAHCDDVFVNAWALCLHVTQEHHLEIYKTDDATGLKAELN